MVFFIRWRVVAEESGAAHFGFGGAMRCSTCWPHDGAVAGGAVADFHFSDISVRGDDGARAIGAQNQILLDNVKFTTSMVRGGVNLKF
jgi:hypothetical protein